MDRRSRATVIPPYLKFTTRVAIYCRISSESRDQLNSLTNQISFLTQYVYQDPTLRLVDIYIDIQSGKNTSARPEFERMMNNCAQKKIDQVITKSVSRFGRNTVDTLAAIYKLRELGIDVYFENDEMHSTKGDNVFMISILEGIAQEENATRSENIKWGIFRGAESGKSKIYNWKCYGYNQDSDIALGAHPAIISKALFDASDIFHSAGLKCHPKNLRVDLTMAPFDIFGNRSAFLLATLP